MTQRSLRILHVGSFGFLARGSSLHGVGPKLSNGFARNGHYVFNFDARQIARGATWFGSRKLGARRANRLLLQFADHFAPEVLVLGHADVIAADTIAELRRRRPALMVLQWNVDPVFNAKNVGRIRNKMAVVDATFVSTAGRHLEPLRSGGHRVWFMPNPADPAIERGRNFEKAELPADFFFAAGTGDLVRHHCGHACDVNALLDRIERDVPGIVMRYQGLKGRPFTAGGAYQDALESVRMGLNLSRRSDHYLYSSNRMAHLMGNGILTFIDRGTGFGDLFVEDELVMYSSEDELIDRIRFFHAHDEARRRVAAAGWRRYYALFDSARVAGYLIDTLAGLVDPRSFSWAR